MRALVLIALALAGPAHAQTRGVTLIPAEPAVDRTQRGVTFVPKGATAPTAPPRWADRLLRVVGLPGAPAATVARNGAVLRAPVTHAVTGELTAPLRRYGD